MASRECGEEIYGDYRIVVGNGELLVSTIARSRATKNLIGAALFVFIIVKLLALAKDSFTAVPLHLLVWRAIRTLIE